MKWTPKMEDKLRKLCFEDKSNADLAKIFSCDVKDIHAARSRLGITIPKVKAAKEADTKIKPERITPKMTVTKAFNNLQDALEEAQKSKQTHSEHVIIYRHTADLIAAIKGLWAGSF